MLRRLAPLLIYLFPALMDAALGAVILVTPIRLAREGFAPVLVTGVMAAWGVVYMLTSFLVGWVVSPRNCVGLMIGGATSTAAACYLFTHTGSVVSIYLAMALFGFTFAFCMTPFQVFMKSIGQGQSKSPAWAAGLYTFAWSVGMAAGRLGAGQIFDWSWRACYLLAMVPLLLGPMCVVALRRLNRSDEDRNPRRKSSNPSTQPTPEKTPPIDYTGQPDLAWLGWVGSGSATLVLALTISLFPDFAVKKLDLSAAVQGNVQSLIAASRAAVALTMLGSRWWMYRWFHVATLGLVGVVGAGLFGMGETAWGFYLAATVYGAYSGGFFFYLVFHALTHPSRTGVYVGVNEVVVGGANVAGPLLGGVLAGAVGYRGTYFTAAVFLAVVVSVQAAVHRRNPARVEDAWA